MGAAEDNPHCLRKYSLTRGSNAIGNRKATMFGPNEWAATYRTSIARLESKLLDGSAAKGKQRQQVEALLAEIKADLARADASLAHALGHPLCECTFPGTPMLWKHQQSAHACPACGYTKLDPRAVKVSQTSRDR